MQNKVLLPTTLVFSLILGLLGGVVSAQIFVPEDVDVEPPRVVTGEAFSYVDAWETASPAVVSVVALKDLTDYYARNGFLYEGGLQEVSSGSAFFVSADGLLVTNRHVVQDSEAQYVILMNDGTEFNVEVLDRDTLNDIALLKITDPSDRLGELPSMEFADSDQISVGEPVLAIGNALGEYSNTTTAGIISATDRQIIATGGNNGQFSLVGLLQTDAAINPGNSGGPLVNLQGELVGMNTAISANGEGLGFAIPANDIAFVLDSYQKFGHIVRPFLGVRHLLVNPSIKLRFNLEFDYGALVIGDEGAGLEAVQEGSSADDAGIQEGDVILAIEGKEITAQYTLMNALSTHLVGDTIRVKVWREGRTRDVDVVLEEKE